jgi:hypothetical protein
MAEAQRPELFKPDEAEVASILMGAAVAAEAGGTKLIQEGVLPSFMREIPYAENVLGSYAVGGVVAALSEQAATRLEADGRPASAKVVRHAGTVAALVCSVGYQAAETGIDTPYQKMAAAMGVIATVPGMIAGRAVARAPFWGVLKRKLMPGREQ